MAASTPDTPMFRQYREMKDRNPDALLFYRMGDFYELFGDDAVWTAHALELTLTSRDKNTENAVPMCGVPHHAVDGYLRRLMEMGRKVAIADQVEDPRLAKGLVKREIVRVLSPGLAADIAEAHEGVWIVAITGGPGGWGLARLDASTGDLRVAEPSATDTLVAELVRVDPKELLLGSEADDPELRGAVPGAVVTPIPEDRAPAAARAELGRRFGVDAEGLGAGLDAVHAVLAYASANLQSPLPNVVRLRPYVLGGTLGLDEATRRNLELFKPLRGTGRVGTLVHLVDQALTPMGGRLLREWLGAPLLDVDAIRGRHDAVAALVADGVRRREVRLLLGGVADVERIAGRVAQGTATPRDLGALRSSVQRLPGLAAASAHPALGALGEDLAEDLAADLDQWLVDDPPPVSGEGGILRDGADPEVDRLRGLSRDAKGAIAALEGRLRDGSGIPSLKVRSNGVFGYYIEVTKANLDRVPPSWHRKQTIANGERFITAELKEYEDEVSGAEEKLLALEARRFTELRARVAAQLPRVGALARGVATLDVYAAFAELAVRQRYVRPDVVGTPGLALTAGRHPVVEATRTEERFVPNDLSLDPRGRLVILTGPNMAGKSTLMRQVALIVLLAQAGSFVPAARARIGVVDRLFVRVGASDDLARGQSTFMVEMAETANILAQATNRSLVLLDEIGRGTSTYDGLAIAWAVAEDLHDRVGALGVFATHYHELAALAETCDAVRNLHVSATEHGDRLVFLRALKGGPAPGSYGIQCARLAGLPGPVVDRARRLLAQMEKRRPKAEATQLSLFGTAPAPLSPASPPAAPLVDEVRAAVEGIDPDALSPREAHAALYRLKELTRS